MAADVDDLRHRSASLDVCRRTGGDARRDARRLLGVHGAVVHRGRNTWPESVRPPPAILARLVEGPGELNRNPGTHNRRLPPRIGVLRLQRRTVSGRDARLRMVDAVRSAAPPRRAGHLRALALGDRQFAPGRVLGRMPVSRRAARRRSAHRRPIWKARVVSRHRVRRPGRNLRCRTRAVSHPTVLRAARRAHPSIDRVWLALRLFRPLARDRVALRIRRRAVRAADFPVRSAGHLGPETNGPCDDVRPAGDRPVAPNAVRRVDRAVAGRPQPSLDAAGGTGTRTCRAGDRSVRSEPTHAERVAGDRCAQHRGVHLGRTWARTDRHVRAQSNRRGRHRALRARRSRRDARAAVARAAGARRRERRPTRVRIRDGRRRETASAARQGTCRNGDGTSASRHSRATWQNAPKSGGSS